MTCEDFELELGEAALSALAQAHLSQCAACRETARLVSLAALPEPTTAERAALVGLEGAARAAWRRRARRRELVSRVLELALAAGVGALAATGVLWRPGPDVAPQPAPKVEPVAVDLGDAEPVWLEAPVVPDLSGDALFQTDDEVSFEVSWPRVTEGEL
jgi:predicted anti-sigma-YlaC factor YlaD